MSEMLFTVTVIHRVPVWAASPAQAAMLAARCPNLADHDCAPATHVEADEAACDLDEVPIGGRGRPLSVLRGAP